MSFLLALDASAEACSVALSLPGGAVLTRFSDQPRSHASKLLPFVEELLSEAAVSIDQLDAIACAIGPGSFTGLRIALSVAQGLSYASDAPLIGVNSLAAMVEDHKLSAGCTDQNTCYLPLLDARMNEVYWAYCSEQSLSVEAYLGNKESFAAAVAEAVAEQSPVLLGEAWSSVPYAADIVSRQRWPLNECATANARAVLSLAQAAYQRGECSKASEVDLCYCRDSVAWNKRTPIRSR